MSALFELLPVATAAVASFAAVRAMLQIAWRVSAEAHMRSLIEMSESIKALRVRLGDAHQEGKIDAAFYSEACGQLEELTQRLKVHERRLVLKGLRQPSVVGRRRYVSKLLEAA